VYKLLSPCLLIISLSVFADNAVDNKERLRDPTMPLGQSSNSNAAASVIPLNLNSVLISNQRRIAIINGQTLRQGDEIKGSGFRVVSIQTNQVRLQSNNATRVLTLIDSRVKK
jgi:MSHA biogenesis protein MshK